MSVLAKSNDETPAIDSRYYLSPMTIGLKTVVQQTQSIAGVVPGYSSTFFIRFLW